MDEEKINNRDSIEAGLSTCISIIIFNVNIYIQKLKMQNWQNELKYGYTVSCLYDIQLKYDKLKVKIDLYH